MAFTISLFYAGLLGLILFGLSLRVVMLRRQLKVGIGSGDQPELEKAIRAHANFCEHAPLALLLLVLLEGAGVVPVILLHVLGAVLVISRVMHGFMGINRTAGVSTGRFVGTLLLWAMILLGSGMAVGISTRWMIG
ncbi:MAG: MAPEG family protein [Pseudomonadota bacterium]